MLKKILKPLYRILKLSFLKIKYSILCNDNFINDFFSEKENYVLFITHGLGGGTFQYEKNYLKEKSEKKILILRIFSYGTDLCYRIENKQNGEELYISPKNINKVFDIKYNEIIINSLIQIYSLFAFIDLLLSYKIKYPEVEYTYHVHDFHCICPSLNLVAQDWYCHLNCEENNCVFDKFIYRYNDDIKKWRRVWEKLLLHTDKIVCFSESSKQILVSVYSNVDKLKVIVSPHDMSYSDFSPVVVESNNSINIGIIGACSYIPKGKLVIERLFREVSKEVCFSMIGSYKRQFQCDRDNVSWYGKYKQKELQSIVANSGVNFVIFPSVWPETFSYLISEVIQMDIPILCFDIGAQGEKVKAYKRGYVCRDIDEMIAMINCRK